MVSRLRPRAISLALSKVGAMRHFDSGRVRSLAAGPAKVLLGTLLSVASFGVLALNATSASAGITSKNLHVRVPARALSPRTEAPGAWDNATEVPGTDALNVGGNAGTNSISCSSSGNCSAGGSYYDGSALSQAFVVNETNGTWGNAVEVPGSAALNVGGFAQVLSVSCSSAGNCGAGGSYTDSAGDTQGFVVNETGGSWGNASEVIDPSAIGSTAAFGVESISCTAAGSCSAVGNDIISGNVSVGFAVSETGGTWSDANEITISSTFGAGGTSLDVISCTSPGNCSAGGNGLYPDAAVSGSLAYIPFEADETNGTWGNPINLPGLATLNVGLNATAVAISCTSPGNCSAGGNYSDDTSNFQAFVTSETNGTWGNAIEVPGTSALNAGGVANVYAVSCSSTGNCAASGVYSDGTKVNQDFVVSETNGAWNNAAEIPGSSSLFIDGTGSVPTSISCSSAGDCSAAGIYLDSVGQQQAFVVNEKSGTWGDAIEVPGTGALNTGGVGGTLSISCSADSGCGAGGFYSTGSGIYQAFVTDMAPLFATQAALHVTSTHGKVGTALKLVTSGGSGTGGLTFSVVNGSAKGCSVSGNSLSAQSAGTCLVTATKASDGTYLAISSTAPIAMVEPARPKILTVHFNANSSTLTPASRSALSTLSKELVKGASITVTGFAKGNAKLAKSRATSVASYLSGKDKTHATIRTVTGSAANAVTVATTKQ